MTNLFGETPKTASQTQAESQKGTTVEPQARPGPLPGGTAPDVTQLIIRAVQEIEDYQRLTAEGKLGEAGQKLEQHKRTLEELKKAGGKPK